MATAAGRVFKCDPLDCNEQSGLEQGTIKFRKHATSGSRNKIRSKSKLLNLFNYLILLWFKFKYIMHFKKVIKPHSCKPLSYHFCSLHVHILSLRSQSRQTELPFPAASQITELHLAVTGLVMQPDKLLLVITRLEQSMTARTQ